MTQRALNGFLEERGVRFFRAGQDRLWSSLEPPRELWGLAIPTLLVLDWLRLMVGPITVKSGYRDHAYNRSVGGARDSLHTVFNAFDVSSRVSPVEMDNYLSAHELYEHISVGVYATFIHVDTRSLIGTKDRWYAPVAQGQD